MAEIEIQKKKNNNIWPWIIGLIIAAILVWLLIEAFDDDNIDDEPATTTETIGSEPGAVAIISDEMPDEVEEYVTFAQQETDGEMDLSHAYTSEGIMKLAAALDALVEQKDIEGAEIDAKRSKMKRKANFIRQNEASTQHADSIKSAFAAATDLMMSIQQANYPNMNQQVNEVKTAADAIQPSEMTLNQKNSVKTFFEKSSQVVESMASTNKSN